MRVLHVFKTYLPDSFTGIERVIYEIAEGTARHGVESTVLSLSSRRPLAPVAVGSHWSHAARLDAYVASTGLSWSMFGAFHDLAVRADLIHYHFPWPMMDVVHLWERPRQPTVVTYHSDIVRQQFLLRFYSPVRDAFLRRVSHIVATSPNYAATSPVLARYRPKTSIIPIGLAPHEPAEPARVERWRQRLGPRFFLFVGAFRYYKGLDYLLEAARLSGLPVVLAGDGPMRERIEASRPANVVLVGRVEDADKAALIELATALVLPSHLRSEAFGVVLLEAARAGRPLVSAEVGSGSSYVNVDQVTGLVVPPADATALAAALQALWHSPELEHRLGAGARQRFEALFTADAMSRQYAELYARLVSAEGGPRAR
jgi:rhamnosyl/mannosyltransferase